MGCPRGLLIIPSGPGGRAHPHTHGCQRVGARVCPLRRLPAMVEYTYVLSPTDGTRVETRSARWLMPTRH